MNNSEQTELVVAVVFTIGIIMLVLIAQFMVFNGYTLTKTIAPSQDSIKTFNELVAVTKYCEQFGNLQHTCVQKYYEYKVKQEFTNDLYGVCA